MSEKISQNDRDSGPALITICAADEGGGMGASMNEDDFVKFVGSLRAKDYIDAEMLRSAGVKSRYEKLFGTPERAARTVFDAFKCSMEAPICDLGARNYDALLEWLRGSV